MKTYLLVLGRLPELSRAELRGKCEEVFYDEEKNLLLAENLQFTNPRELPRAEEQLFIDQLGGTIRMAEVIDEYFDKAKLQQAIWQRIEAAQKFKVGFTVFGGGKNLLGDLMGSTKQYFEKNPPSPLSQGGAKRKIRIENFKGQNLSSGQIFQRRILQKGHEFIVWQRRNSYLLAETVANQNLRNYELRDRGKDFRDAKMGMLPPKLAQILLNLAVPGVQTFSEERKETDLSVGTASQDRSQWPTVLDPFCGSGTINIEAAIAGYPTKGSDLNESFVTKAEANFVQMGTKFRYPEDSGKFRPKDAKFCMDEIATPTVIATEGYLGENFVDRPRKDEVQKNAGAVYDLWRQVLKHVAQHQVERLALCLPAWNQGHAKVSISAKVIAYAQTLGYEPELFPAGTPTAFYEREDAFVAREVLVIQKKPTNTAGQNES